MRNRTGRKIGFIFIAAMTVLAGRTPAAEQTQGTEKEQGKVEYIEWNDTWQYAGFSKIHSDKTVLFHAEDAVCNGHTVCVNAGHGTSGGEQVHTLCHPDGTPKVTSGSTAAGAVEATAIAAGTTLLDGTTEAKANLQMALILKDLLLAEGYNVLMPRTTEDAQLDNIARTVLANELAECHLSIHYDSTERDKGFFYMSVPDVASYRAMEPVASHWEGHEKLGQSILEGVKKAGIPLFENGSMPVDLTQTSYSTVPSVDLEVGDRASKWSEDVQTGIAKGIVEGVNIFFG